MELFLCISRLTAKHINCQVHKCYGAIVGRINVTISDELEKEFRELIFKKKGWKKGKLKEAIKEAVTLWIEKNKS